MFCDCVLTEKKNFIFIFLYSSVDRWNLNSADHTIRIVTEIFIKWNVQVCNLVVIALLPYFSSSLRMNLKTESTNHVSVILPSDFYY